MAPLICLITPGHAASTPRLVKNANALAGAGYRVHVISGRNFPPADPLDAALFAEARWTHTVLNTSGGSGTFARKLLRLAARRLLGWTARVPLGMAARAHHAETFRFAAAAAAIPADLYLGHCLPGLPAAAWAARQRGVPYGFDAEDYHEAETEESIADPAEQRARHALQARLLQGCSEITAGSPLIALRLGRDYGVKPMALLNVFPLADAPVAPSRPVPISAGRPARLYWFSQTIGPRRGLEEVIAALGRTQTPTEMHLRGFISPDYRRTLEALSRAAGLARPPVILPPGPPAEMVRLAADSDLGLSTEHREPISRDLCLSNKIFAYLLAGLPQLLSATTSQSALAGELGPAALLGNLDQPGEIAQILDAFFANPTGMAAARRTAWQLGRSRFCWDVEQRRFLEVIARIVPPS